MNWYALNNNPDNLTLLIRPGEKPPTLGGLPMMRRVADPGPAFRRLRRFFRPWRLIGRAFVVTVPCWLVAALAAVGGWLTGAVASIAESLVPYAEAGMSTATFFTLLPLGILALWAAVLGLRDLSELGRIRRADAAYRDALTRLGEPGILTPADLRLPGVCQGLETLGHYEKLLASVDRDKPRISGLLRDALHQAGGHLRASVLDLVATERRLLEWSGRLGPGSGYTAKLAARRDALVAAYPGILDQCLHTADRALAGHDDAHADPADLARSVTDLLDSCERALKQAEDQGPAIDEQELLMYAAKARERAAGPAAEGERPERA